MRAHACLLLACLPLLAAAQARLDTASPEQLVQALQGEVPVARSNVRALTARAPDPLTNLCVADGNTLPEQVGAARRNLYVSDAPKVDLNVRFGFDSARLIADNLPLLDALGQALNSPALQGQRFVIAGHTDRHGAELYNKRLSCERALAVRAYLLSKHGIEPARLLALGFGADKLADVNDPESELNRRVEVRKF